MLCHIVEHGAQVFQVEDEQSAVVGYTKHDMQHTVLSLIELEQSGEQLRSHLRDSGAHGVPLFAVDIEEAYGAVLELWVLDAEFRQSFLYEPAHLARL